MGKKKKLKRELELANWNYAELQKHYKSACLKYDSVLREVVELRTATGTGTVTERDPDQDVADRLLNGILYENARPPLA